MSSRPTTQSQQRQHRNNDFYPNTSRPSTKHRSQRPDTRSTTVGLGTVGLGENCRRAYQDALEARYEEWKRNKIEQMAEERAKNPPVEEKRPVDVYEDEKRARERRAEEKELREQRLAEEHKAEREQKRKLLQLIKVEADNFVKAYTHDEIEAERAHREANKDRVRSQNAMQRLCGDEMKQHHEEVRKEAEQWGAVRSQEVQQLRQSLRSAHDGVFQDRKRANEVRKSQEELRKEEVRAARQAVKDAREARKAERNQNKQELAALAAQARQELKSATQKAREKAEREAEELCAAEKKKNEDLQKTRADRLQSLLEFKKGLAGTVIDANVKAAESKKKCELEKTRAADDIRTVQEKNKVEVIGEKQQLYNRNHELCLQALEERRERSERLASISPTRRGVAGRSPERRPQTGGGSGEYDPDDYDQASPAARSPKKPSSPPKKQPRVRHAA